MERAPNDPMAFAGHYENASRVFGAQPSPFWLVDRVKTFDWRASFGRLAHLSAIIGNDEDGVRASRPVKMMLDGLRSLTSSVPSTKQMLDHARRYVADRSGRVFIAHEEALLFLQHVAVLHGKDDGDEAPGDGELALWLLAANDYLDAWSEPDARALSTKEELIAEQVKAFRFNRNADSLRMAVRTYRMFLDPPPDGKLAEPSVWASLQNQAFGGSYKDYFEQFALLLFMLSHSWGTGRSDSHEYPVLFRERFAASGESGLEFFDRLESMAVDRVALRQDISKRMRPDGILPHAPTALIHHPLVNIGEGRILAASPWGLRGFLRTGVWARFLAGAKSVLKSDRNGGDEWLRAFGKLFEEWLRTVARFASATSTRSQIILASSYGAEDEIEDVVVREDEGAAFFSAKGRMVKESVARHAISRSGLIDWYNEYFFEARNDEFRGGAVRQLSKRIDMLRDGKFEPRLDSNTRVYPAIVTFDSLCENPLLYEWIEERCRAESLLQQPNVGAISLCDVEDFERIMAHGASGGSIVELLRLRDTKWHNRRIQVQLSEEKTIGRVPELETMFSDAVNAMTLHHFNRTIR